MFRVIASKMIVLETQGIGIRTYIAEPDRGPRKWEDKEEEQQAVYSNRRRIRGARGRRLMRKRGELLERPFAHSLETGGMRRVYLRGHENILKRLLIHVAGLNLGMYMRKLFGVGTPRSLQGLGKGLCAAFLTLWRPWVHQARNLLRELVILAGSGSRLAEIGNERVA